MKRLELIDRLAQKNELSGEELLLLLTEATHDEREYLYAKAVAVRERHYGRKVYLRGLIEISNFCRCACRYCGINVHNRNVERYRLSEEDILNTCRIGYELGFRTFVLQGGEDHYFSDECLKRLLHDIKKYYPDCAVTLSLGERGYSSYAALREAGADRYLLRHETASQELYSTFHPGDKLEDRVDELKMLTSLGYQTGGGCLVGLPGQTPEDNVNDLLLFKQLKLKMVGIGPFIPHHDTELRNCATGRAEDVLTMVALTRLLLPAVLLPATTALATIATKGRYMALHAGANVVMPNLTPASRRQLYTLYDGKKVDGTEAGEALELIKKEINDAGFVVAMERGDAIE